MMESNTEYGIMAKAAGAILWAAVAGTLEWRFVSEEAERLLGYPKQEWFSCPTFWQEIIHPQDRRRVVFLFMQEEEGRSFDVEYRLIGDGGRTVWIKNVVRTMETGGERLLVGVMVDITENKRQEEELTYFALHDPLTGLPNRLLLMDRLEHLLRNVARGYEGSFALMFIDLDGFKQVNDLFGHQAGDRMIVEFARRLERCLRRSDTLARIGGDEFVVLTEHVNSAGGARLAACRILEALALPFRVAGQEIRIGASIGIAMGSSGYEEPEAILRDADRAMYGVKAKGGKGCKIFSREPQDQKAAVAI